MYVSFNADRLISPWKTNCFCIQVPATIKRRHTRRFWELQYWDGCLCFRQIVAVMFETIVFCLENGILFPETCIRHAVVRQLYYKMWQWIRIVLEILVRIMAARVSLLPLGPFSKNLNLLNFYLQQPIKSRHIILISQIFFSRVNWYSGIITIKKLQRKKCLQNSSVTV